MSGCCVIRKTLCDRPTRVRIQIARSTGFHPAGRLNFRYRHDETHRDAVSCVFFLTSLTVLEYKLACASHCVVCMNKLERIICVDHALPNDTLFFSSRYHPDFLPINFKHESFLNIETCESKIRGASSTGEFVGDRKDGLGINGVRGKEGLRINGIGIIGAPAPYPISLNP